MQVHGQSDCLADRLVWRILPPLDRHAALRYHRWFTISVVCLIWPPIRRTIHADAHRSNPRHKPGREHPNNFLPKIAKD